MSARISNVITIALLAVVLSIPTHADADALAEQEKQQRALFHKTAPSVVYISSKGGIGTGFFVDAGIILTSNHVVGNRKTVDVILHDARRVRATVLERAKDDVDLALLQVPVKDIPPLELSMGKLTVGDWVASVGHGVDSPWTFTVGMVSNIYPHKAQRPVFQTQIPLNPGNSGGPIVDRRGRVVGIVTAGVRSANNVNFAIRPRVAAATLSKLGRCDCLIVTAPKGIPVFVDGQMVGKGPRVLVPMEAGRHTVSAVVGKTLVERKIRYPATKSVELFQ